MVYQLLLAFQMVVSLPHPSGLLQGATPEEPEQRCTAKTPQLRYLPLVTQVRFS